MSPALHGAPLTAATLPMLSWFFKKWKAPAAPVVAPVTPAAVQAQAQQAALAKAEARSRQDDTERAAWQPRLQAAIGDDAALLAVAQAAPGLDIKLAAVQAMAGEPTLRQAERAFRGHDRRVHRLAKQRLEAAVARRTTQARVLALTDSATALVGQTDVPLNHLVALDRDWRALDAAWIEVRNRPISTRCASASTAGCVSSPTSNSAGSAGWPTPRWRWPVCARPAPRRRQVATTTPAPVWQAHARLPRHCSWAARPHWRRRR